MGGAAGSREKENSPEKSGEFHREEKTLSYLYDDVSHTASLTSTPYKLRNV
jgi:hypothetical protein